MNNTNWMAEGNKVTGQYCGIDFAGTVTEVRFAPIGYHAEIALNSPIMVFGQERKTIGFYSGDKDSAGVATV